MSENLKALDMDNVLVVAESDYFLPAGNEEGIWTYILEVFALSPEDGEIVEKIIGDEVDGTGFLERPTPFYLTRSEIEQGKLEEGRLERDFSKLPQRLREDLAGLVLDMGGWGLEKIANQS